MEKIGLGLIGAAAVGTAIHGGLTLFKSIPVRDSSKDNETLAAFGDAPVAGKES